MAQGKDYEGAPGSGDMGLGFIEDEDYVPYGSVPSSAPTASDPEPPPPGDGGGGGGGGVSIPMPGGLSLSPTYNFERAPGFAAPKFTAPDWQTAMNDPGYQFRLRSGADALERSAAARGVLRTGGTLKDLGEYGQNFASQEYGNIFNRALQDYNTRYQGAKDEYAPQYADWQMRQNAELGRGNQQFAREWDVYALQNNLDMSRNQLLAGMLNQPPLFPQG